MSNSGPRTQYWKRGVEALCQLGLNLPPVYVCPICLRGFSEKELEHLTREHVPPKAVGGKRLVLTCRDCNSLAGYKLDAHAHRRQEVVAFSQQDPAARERARLQIGDHEVNIEARWESGALTIAGIPMVNAPGATEELGRLLEERYRRGQGFPRFTLDFRLGFSERRARIAMLRAAYLAAFATLGYRYVLRPVLHVVREQIRCPDEEVIKHFSLEIPDDAKRENGVILLREPRWANGVAVQIDRNLFLLPFHDQADDYYRRFEGKQLAGKTVHFDGKLFGWPRIPEYILDFADQRDIQMLLHLLD